jgi:hypothetical protein
MERPHATAAPRRNAGLFFLLVAIAILWRLPFSALCPMSSGDETKYSMPTVERIEAGEFPTYIVGTDYGAPVHEWLAAIFRRTLGHSLLAFRLPLILFGAFAAGVFFLSLRTAISTGAAFALALLVACPPSTTAFYTAFSQPAYAATLLCVALIQVATFRVDRSRTRAAWALLGLLMGAAVYVFKLSVLQSGVSLIWLFARSENGRGLLAEIDTNPEIRKRAKLATGFALAAALAIAPVAYRALTRRGIYQISRPEIALVALAVPLFIASFFIAIRLIRIRPGPLSSGAAFACAFAVFAVLPSLRFTFVEKPRLTASHVKLYTEAAYSLKHLHEWPFQVKLFAERVFPALILGRMSTLEPYPVNGVRCGWKTAVTAAIFAALAFGAFRRWGARSGREIFDRNDLVITAPFFLVIAVMAPSWSLHGDFCYRYLFLFFPGLLLFAFRCIEPAFPRWQNASIAVMAIYVLYAANDCRIHIPRSLVDAPAAPAPAAYFPRISPKNSLIAFHDSLSAAAL